MKAVIVSKEDMSVLVKLTDKNITMNSSETLGLKEGDDFAEFYRRNKDVYSYRKTNFWITGYTKQEKLDRMKTKNPSLNSLIQKFELV